MELTKWGFGFTMLIFGMGFTLITLFVLTLVTQFLAGLFKPKVEKKD